MILHWGRMNSQAIDPPSHWIEVGERAITGVPNQVEIDSQQFQIVQWQICSFSHLGSN